MKWETLPDASLYSCAPRSLIVFTNTNSVSDILAVALNLAVTHIIMLRGEIGRVLHLPLSVGEEFTVCSHTANGIVNYTSYTTARLMQFVNSILEAEYRAMCILLLSTLRLCCCDYHLHHLPGRMLTPFNLSRNAGLNVRNVLLQARSARSRQPTVQN